MTHGPQSQKAGANAQQIQVSGDYIVQQYDEERAWEIATEAARIAVTEYSGEALTLAYGRMEQMHEKLIKRLIASESLEIMADPAFQASLRRAQAGAAATERPEDYNLLASLLAERAEKPNDRPVRAGVNRAIEVVDQLDDTSLNALTLYVCVNNFRPNRIGLDDALEHMEQLLGLIMEGHRLPEPGDRWLENLEVLDAVRIDMLQEFIPFAKRWPHQMPEYLARGVVAGETDDNQGTAMLMAMQCPLLPVSHELKPGYNRMPGGVPGNISRILRENYGWTPEKISPVLDIAQRIYGSGDIDESLIPTFIERVRERPYQRALSDWWDSLGRLFTVTVVGRALAQANVRRLDTSDMLPDFDWI